MMAIAIMMAMVVAAVAATAITLQWLRRSQRMTMMTTAMMTTTMAAAVVANPTIRNMTTILMGGGCSPTGDRLYYPDDDVLLDDICDDDYMEKHFSSIPDKPVCDQNRNQITGGPQPPDANATDEEKNRYISKQKAFADANRRKLLSALSSVDMDVLPQKQVVKDHTGNQFPHIRLMSGVKNCPLMAGHTFAKKETMMLRIGEEANLCNIRVKVLKSCQMQYEVAGDSFYVKASNLMFQR